MSPQIPTTTARPTRPVVAPVDWRISDLSVVEPDRVVTLVDDLDGAYLSATPLLVVEVLSPSTRLTDLGTKRMRYERSGVGDYWLVDPEVPRLTAQRFDGGTCRKVAVVDDEQYDADAPLAVLIRPTDLVRR